MCINECHTDGVFAQFFHTYHLFLIYFTGNRQCITDPQDLLQLLRRALGSHGKQSSSSSEQDSVVGKAASSAADKFNKSTAQTAEGCERIVRKIVDNLEEEKASDPQKVSKNQGNM